MSRDEVSTAISNVEKRNPDLARKRVSSKARVREQKYGRELLSKETEWNQFADTVGFLLAVYEWRSEIVVDVLLVNEAYVTTRGKLKISVAAPKRRQEKHLGVIFEWERDFDLPIEALLHYEPLHSKFDHEIVSNGVDVYRSVIEHGLKMAKKINRANPI